MYYARAPTYNTDGVIFHNTKIERNPMANCFAS